MPRICYSTSKLAYDPFTSEINCKREPFFLQSGCIFGKTNLQNRVAAVKRRDPNGVRITIWNGNPFGFAGKYCRCFRRRSVYSPNPEKKRTRSIVWEDGPYASRSSNVVVPRICSKVVFSVSDFATELQLEVWLGIEVSGYDIA